MFKLIFFYKINLNKNKKRYNYNNLGSLLLLKYFFKNSKIFVQKLFFNKYLMIKSPFHYKVSKKLIYNKQGIVKFQIVFKSKFNYLYFLKYSLLTENFNSSLLRIDVVNKK